MTNEEKEKKRRRKKKKKNNNNKKKKKKKNKKKKKEEKEKEKENKHKEHYVDEATNLVLLSLSEQDTKGSTSLKLPQGTDAMAPKQNRNKKLKL